MTKQLKGTMTIPASDIQKMQKRKTYKRIATESVVFAATQSIKDGKTYYVIPTACGYHVTTDARDISRTCGYYEVFQDTVSQYGWD